MDGAAVAGRPKEQSIVMTGREAFRSSRIKGVPDSAVFQHNWLKVEPNLKMALLSITVIPAIDTIGPAQATAREGLE